MKLRKISRGIGAMVLAAIPLTGFGFSAAVSFHTSTTQVPAGSTVTINETLAIAPGKAKTYMQRGMVVDRIAHTYEPYCYFALKRPRSEMGNAGAIQAEVFKVEKEYRRMEQMAQTPRTLASSISIGISIGGGTWLARNEGGPQNLNYYMDISSATQPTVSHFVCGVFSDPRERGIPSLDEMRKAVGTLVTIEVAQ
jgi:hypothetical protein